MHILIIHQAFASLTEPGGTRHHEFARMLVASGHQVTVIASPVSYITGTTTQAQDSNEYGVTILRASVYDAHHKSFFHRIIAFFSFMLSSFWIGLGVKNVDVIWGTSPPIFQGVTAWALARLKGVKFLFEVRDLWPQFAIAVGVLKNPILIKFSEWLERFLYAHSDHMIVNSPGFVESVASRGAKRVELIPNGADPSMFDPNDDGIDFRKLYKLENKFVVMYAGAHGMSNDLHLILESASLLADNSFIQFILVGDGKEKLMLQAQAKSLKLKNVLFLPSVSKTKMPATLAGADVCVAILKPLEEYKTTYPNKVFDYMAAGKPVVLAIDGVIRAVVEAAQCGLFAKPGDAKELTNAIVRISQNQENARAMGLRGREYLELHFSRKTISEKLLVLLEKIIL